MTKPVSLVTESISTLVSGPWFKYGFAESIVWGITCFQTGTPIFTLDDLTTFRSSGQIISPLPLPYICSSHINCLCQFTSETVYV